MMRKTLGAVLIFWCGLAAAQTQSAWWHQVPANVANNDGSVSLTDANGNPVNVVANPTAATVKPNQAAVTQPPTVIVQATTGYWKDPVGSFAVLPTTGNQVGDTRMVTGLGRAFSWNGATWAPLAADQNGTMTANEFQPQAIATAGAACPAAGRQAMESTGAPLFCQSGIWQGAGQTPPGTMCGMSDFVGGSDQNTTPCQGLDPYLQGCPPGYVRTNVGAISTHWLYSCIKS